MGRFGMIFKTTFLNSLVAKFISAFRGSKKLSYKKFVKLQKCNHMHSCISKTTRKNYYFRPHYTTIRRMIVIFIMLFYKYFISLCLWCVWFLSVFEIFVCHINSQRFILLRPYMPIK